MYHCKGLEKRIPIKYHLLKSDQKFKSFKFLSDEILVTKAMQCQRRKTAFT